MFLQLLSLLWVLLTTVYAQEYVSYRDSIVGYNEDVHIEPSASVQFATNFAFAGGDPSGLSISTTSGEITGRIMYTTPTTPVVVQYDVTGVPQVTFFRITVMVPAALVYYPGIAVTAETSTGAILPVVSGRPSSDFQVYVFGFSVVSASGQLVGAPTNPGFNIYHVFFDGPTFCSFRHPFF